MCLIKYFALTEAGDEEEEEDEVERQEEDEEGIFMFYFKNLYAQESFRSPLIVLNILHFQWQLKMKTCWIKRDSRLQLKLC
jgi:hypothetical protein